MSHTANLSGHHGHPAQSPLVHSQAHTSSNYSIQSQPSSRSSDTTQGTAHSTLFPPPPMPSNASSVAAQGGPSPGGDVTATKNIMNIVADKSTSLFQICVSLRQRLHGVPGLNETMIEEEQEADEDTDPVTLLWRTFRRGYPLMLLYNALNPSKPLTLGAGVKEYQRGKAATFKFLQACINDLKFAQEDCFIVTDLYGDDTTGFVKVARVVNRVLDILVERGLVDDVRPTASDFEQAEKGIKRTQRQHIVSEMVTTERTYVQHLELLQAFKHLVEERGVIPGDAVHDIFLNLNSLLDFQRRFLIRVEQTNAQAENEQNWGRLFVLYNEAFKVYEPYIANQRKCERTVVAEYPKLKDAGGNSEMRQIVESSTSLYGFLMKPFQRISKYPLLLDDLYKKGDLDDERKADLLLGKEAATSVLARTNHAVDREEKAEAVEELNVRVEDWKGHRVEGFGELLLYGTFTVQKNENPASGKEGERQYHVYLFQTILLCCKDIDPSKPKNKLSTKQLVDKRGKPKLQLKGRIFMQNVTDVIQTAKPGSYTCQIFWKGDPSIENFVIRFTTEELMKKWTAQVETQRRHTHEPTGSGRLSDGSRGTGTSQTEFEFMRNQPQMVNPYQEEDEDEPDAPYRYGSRGEFASSRNGSSSSLWSTSSTLRENGPPPISANAPRGPTPRFPAGSISQQQQPALSVRTREFSENAARSPSERPGGESYFSPSAGDSPAALSSARTSDGSSIYNFPRQQYPPVPGQQNGYYEEGHGHSRFTAPAMARQREPSGGAPPPGNRPMVGGRAAGMHSAQSLPPQHRHRSASSPDIHNNAQPRAAGPRPPVPDMPASYSHQIPQQQFHQQPHMTPRSQSNSPSLQNGYQSSQRGPPGRGPPGPYAYTGPMPPSGSRPELKHYPTSSSVPPQTGPPSHPSSRNHTPVPPPPITRAETFSPPPPTPSTPFSPDSPTQLKVKVHCPAAGQTLTLVVPLTITYQSLVDRIDAKLQRSTNLTLSGASSEEGGERAALPANDGERVKLKYLDEDDYVSIQSDEDVAMAFESWREQFAGRDGGGGGGGGGSGEVPGAMGEVVLFCQK